MLSTFVAAALGADNADLDAARSALVSAIGGDGMRDAAAVIGNFQRMVRIADGTGIPLDAATEMATRTEREVIGVGDFASAKNTPVPGIVQRIAGRLSRPFVGIGMRIMARRAPKN